MNALRRFYWGETKVDFVGHARAWFLVSGILVIGSLVVLGVRGLTYSIEFSGGTAWVVQAKDFKTSQANDVVAKFDIGPTTAQDVGEGVRVEAREVPPEQADAISKALAEAAGIKVDEISKVSVGPSWGAQVSRKALQGFIFFLIAVVIYISIRFEFKMAVVALAEMFHDLIVIVGVYAIGEFQVGPATVIGVLTMLGYSLYDAVVVFDKIRENSPLLASGRLTYTDVVNRSMNQTMARSAATSLSSLLPAASLLFVGSVILGAATLRDLALALFVGIASGSYSSIFFASPLLAEWKEREPRYRQIRSRVDARAARTGRAGAPRGRPATALARSSGADDEAEVTVGAPRAATAGASSPTSTSAGSAPSDSSPSRTTGVDKGAAKGGGQKQSARKRHGRSTPISRKRRRR